MYVCLCNRISIGQLAASWAETNPDLDRLAERLGLYSERCCGRCADELDELVDVAECSASAAGAAR